MKSEKSAILWTDCDKALIGIAERCGAIPLPVYDYNKLLVIFQKQGMEPHEAAEWIEYNILGAYVGTRTPLIMFPMKPKECIERITDGDEE